MTSISPVMTQSSSAKSKKEIELIKSFDEAKTNHIDLSLHGDGTVQRFQLQKHKDYLLAIFNKALKQEVLRIDKRRRDAETENQRLADEWRKTLQNFLGKSNRPRIFSIDMDRYSVYGKSFDIPITSISDALEIIRGWKRLCASKMITGF